MLLVCGKIAMKLKTKLLLAYQSIAVVLLLITSIVFTVLFFKEKINTSQDQMADRMTLVSAMLKNTPLTDKGELPESVKEFFDEAHWIEMGLFTTDPAKLLFKTKQFPITDLNDIKPQKLYNALTGGDAPEALMIDNATKNIWGYTAISEKKWVIVGYIPSEKTYRILYLLALKLSFIGLFAIGVVTLIAQYLSTDITDYISYIKQHITLFGKGKFDSRIKEISSDELGDIAKNFNVMANQIGDLVSSEKVRIHLENEIMTAQRIQKFFFPDLQYKSEKVQIRGHYEAAEYCGGDWWYYHDLKDRIYILIGDVTGHGTPSAMLTSSCRSILANTFYHNPTPASNEILQEINHAINQTVKGDLNMTMCVLCYHYETKTLTYSNASHEMPMFWPIDKGEISKKDIDSLIDIHGPRLGENDNAVFGVSTKVFEGPVRLLLYSDGLTELSVKPEGMLGERALLKIIISTQNHIQNDNNALAFYTKFHAKVKEINGGAAYADDLSYLIIDLNL